MIFSNKLLFYLVQIGRGGQNCSAIAFDNRDSRGGGNSIQYTVHVHVWNNIESHLFGLFGSLWAIESQSAPPFSLECLHWKHNTLDEEKENNKLIDFNAISKGETKERKDQRNEKKAKY